MKSTFFMAILFVTITSSAAIPAEKAGDPAAKAPVPAPSKANPPSQKGIPPTQKGTPPAQNVVTPPGQNSTLPGGSIWGCDDAKVKGVVFSFRGCEVEYEEPAVLLCTVGPKRALDQARLTLECAKRSSSSSHLPLPIQPNSNIGHIQNKTEP
ncbi:hypothetical protein PGTUg99_010774 [Puccinia graminis f. sp. tritici]|uniref:Uncharacterized protein n=1 Tax=Puccinia graminis f. sp. tritici TaxID=56615 RepID=A0A5B0RH49_PUCGR|nr:hypothetical protein PGTUg99_010774 [Puccinia graminis f. sp. tritici]